ncbi:hypothetical protein MLD38_038323 [Melastoma candidum]|uniref:Uncharacterized protein n=1 Tax=Melastoma candidum TaxID=119954 RepID=A0ACB9KYJ0_9MYRT|nr:hypothetical protein MLD38_038323 [Melastoma candidum]
MSPPVEIRNWVILFVLCLTLGSLTFYLTGESYRHTYSTGDTLFAKMNSLTSIQTLIPFSYYSLPFCKPLGGIMRRSSRNLGGALMGDQVMNSPYRFSMNINESKYLCTTSPLSLDDVAVLQQRIRELYQVNIALDSLPARRYVNTGHYEIMWTGFQVGYNEHRGDENVYVINHLKFRISVHESSMSGGCMIGGDYSKYGYEIVGFEVVPYSINYRHKEEEKLKMYDDMDLADCPFNHISPQIIRENEQISFTYEVEFVKSDLAWSSRWDLYVEKNVRILWSSVMSSMISILFLSCIVLVIFLRSVWRELRMHDELGKLTEPAYVNSESSGWKIVAGDAFRKPSHPMILCALVGNGVQITIAAIVAVALARSGFVTPALRRLVLTQVIMLYLLAGLIGGYVSVTLWKMIQHTVERWHIVSLLAGLLFPGISFLVHLIVNFALWKSKSTAVISIYWYSVFLSLWLLVSLPLTVLGGFLAKRVETIQFPVPLNDIPREIPRRRFPVSIAVAASGILPFGILFIQLLFILSSITFNRNFSSFGFLLLSLVMFVISCGGVSLVLTYRNLSAENWQWWWKAFFASGSVGVYMFLYCINYLVYDLKGLSSPATTVVYLSYALIAAVSIMLSAGSIGLLVSFLFVVLLYSCIKV